MTNAAATGYLLASAHPSDNYARIWARDSAVTILGILAGEVSALYPTALGTLELLQKAASVNGQIPSNVAITNTGEIENVSFGSVAGRTDTSFWWLIGSFTYLKKVNDENFRKTVQEQASKIFALAEAWEFNGKDLMYVPMSSNWADEYITHGYVLYDQLLRYWALQLAADDSNNSQYAEKAGQIKKAIKQHFLFEQPLAGSLYTLAQQQAISGYELDKNFIASFSPGDRVERFDAWSIALLLLLDIPSAENGERLFSLMGEKFLFYGQTGIPAFWPEISDEDPAFEILRNNFSYRFKNKAGHFHNGGIWPVVNGFLISALYVCEQPRLANQLLQALKQNLSNSKETHPFTEYFSLHEGLPGGTAELCFSAAGYLLADQAANDLEKVTTLMPDYRKRSIAISQQYTALSARIVTMFHPLTEKCLVLAIAGQSGSGKTTLGHALKHSFEQQGLKTLLLHQDDYFKLPPRKNHLAREADFEHIGYSEVRLTMLDEALSAIKTQSTDVLTVPHMNWLNDTEERRTLNLNGIRIVLVEGTYTSLLKEADIRIFFNTDYSQTQENRKSRARDAASDFIERVLEKENELISVHEPMAHLVINRKLEIETIRDISSNL